MMQGLLELHPRVRFGVQQRKVGARAGLRARVDPQLQKAEVPGRGGAGLECRDQVAAARQVCDSAPHYLSQILAPRESL